MANILVVDDTNYLRQVLNLMLQKNNHRIASARNGQEAMAYLSHSQVDMMISDINMPVMDGLSLLENVRSDERLKRLPVILVTASGQEQIPEEAAQKGANGFLTQPFSSQELDMLVSSCLAA